MSINGHNDAIEALRHARKRLDGLEGIEKAYYASEEQRRCAEAELRVIGAEFMYCKTCNARFRFKPGFDQTDYCFTCLGKHVDEVEELQDQIAELHDEIEFIDGPIVSALIGAPERDPVQAFPTCVIQFGWLLCLMASTPSSVDGGYGGPEFCCSEASPPGGCWGDIACEPCGGCALHCACEEKPDV